MGCIDALTLKKNGSQVKTTLTDNVETFDDHAYAHWVASSLLFRSVLHSNSAILHSDKKKVESPRRVPSHRVAKASTY